MMLKIDLQFFGGRGASSSVGSGGGLSRVRNTFAISDPDGNEMGLIIELKNGASYWQNSRGEISELPNGTSAEDYADRVTKNGGSAKRLTKSDLDKKDAEHKAYRKEMDKFLDLAYANDKTMKQGSSASRKTNRGSRRA